MEGELCVKCVVGANFRNSNYIYARVRDNMSVGGRGGGLHVTTACYLHVYVCICKYAYYITESRIRKKLSAGVEWSTRCITASAASSSSVL